MIAIDSNVLLRIAVRDTPAQSDRAKALLDGAVAAGERIAIAPLVLAEVVWAMRQSYKLPKNEISAFLSRVAHAAALMLIDRDIVVTAIGSYAEGSADFADYLIAGYAERAGATELYSFDRDALKSGRFVAVP